LKNFPVSRFALIVSALLGAILLEACTISKVQDSKELTEKSLPSVTLPNQFVASSNVAGISVDMGWLKQFNDAELNALVTEALKNNPDIRVMAARRSQAESLIDAAGGSQYPGVNAIGNVGGKAGSSGSGITGYYIGANWELDLWGRVRTSVAAAKQNSKAINADQDAARLSLIATLTKSVWIARNLQSQSNLANENAQAATKYAELMQVREKIGASSISEVSAALANAAQSKEAAISAAQTRDQGLRAVEVLVGRYPKAEPLKTTYLPDLPPPVSPGLPADLLERRPDVIAAEARVNSAFYLADEKRLARLPKISLTAGFGYINSQIFSLINPSNTSFGVGANASVPLFMGGAIEAQIAYQNAEAQAALANYGKIVLTAFNDVENALSGEANWRERSKQLEIELKEQKQIMQNTSAELKIGRVDQRQVQQQIITTNTSEMRWRQGKVDALAQRVNLYLALGGSAEN
jgi:NodT family efflux transporter outer membrane factor (OMF) lipoprotein